MATVLVVDDEFGIVQPRNRGAEGVQRIVLGVPRFRGMGEEFLKVAGLPLQTHCSSLIG